MDAQSAGSMLIMTGVALVLFAGYRLRVPQSPPESVREQGLTLSMPAYLGAVPWVASKIAMPVS